MTAHSLLASFHAIALQHDQQFTPPLEHLGRTIHTTLQQLQTQEQALVTAQAQALAEVQTQLATDARVLINSTELDEFVVQVQALPRPQHWNDTETEISVSPRSAEWQLAKIGLAIRVSDYTPTVDHDAYDDERTYSTYGYAVTLDLQSESERLEVVTRSIYSPVDIRTYSVRERLEFDIDGYVVGMVDSLGLDVEIESQVAAEVTYLVGCAVQLLSLAPRSVQFQYPLEEGVA